MNKITDLTQGSIFSKLWIMAVPLISASFIQMAYNMTDMLWLGHLGSESVAAVGAAGFFIWLCGAISYLTKTGSEITVSQSIGAGDEKRALRYANHSVTWSFIFAFICMVVIFITAPYLISVFSFEEDVAFKSSQYLRIVAPGIFFLFNNNTFSGIYNGQGNSKTPFKITAIGLVINITLDPLLIYGYGFIPAMGTAGAAIATTFSQLVVFAVFFRKVFGQNFPLGKIKPFKNINKKFSGRILLLGMPVTIQNGLFSMFSLTLATLAARWGSVGVATQSIGSQIEAISWMTATGFSTALAAFTGQNYGAGKYDRIQKGYRITLLFAGSIGLFAGICFYVFDREIFGLFVKEADILEAGSMYLKILAFSQLFMVIEMVTAGVFNGCGRTIPPALTGTILTGVRIPLAFYLCSFPALGLNGIWWSITISSILKGTILPLWYFFFQRKLSRSR